jgi:DNA-binding NarL/FixJ family response regulator
MNDYLSERNRLARCLVVARDPLARAGLAALLQGEGLAVVGAADEHEVEQAEGLYRPDVLVWDLGAGGSPGAQPGRTRLPVLMLGEALGIPRVESRPDGDGARRGWGLLPRTAAAGMLRAAVRAVLDGLAVLDPEIHWPAQEPAPGKPLGGRPGAGGGAGVGLSERPTGREQEVLELLALGLPNKQIALRLGISDHTVKFHLNALMGKLGAETRTEAVTRAARAGWLKL